MRHEDGLRVALRIADACFDAHHAAPAPDGLLAFQSDAYHRLRGIIARRGGAILADSVGLGKTHVATAIIRAATDDGGDALIVAPAQLRAHWTRHLRGLPRCRVASHTALSRGARRIATAALVVVDEAHAFRNPRARRYEALALLCEHSSVLLVTATPVNNSLFDFYHLVRLFAGRDAFADVGVPDLLTAVESAAHGGSGSELRRVAAAVMVRRTRRVLERSGAHDASVLRFPVCAPIQLVRCDPDARLTALLDLAQDVIPRLTFAAHCLDGDAVPRELMRLGLLKRLESSTWALHASVRRHIRILEHFIAAAHDGLLFDPRTDMARTVETGDSIQLTLRSIALRPWPPSLDRARLMADADADLHALRSLRNAAALRSNTNLNRHDAATDPKVLRLMELLDESDERVLLFTEFRDTAHGLWRALANRPGIAMLHGSDARLGRGRSSRRAIIERFAPVANHARTPRRTEHVRLLIATDVLAEGMNLQDAAILVSYDLPWNPVRLAQRIGRIVRLGSPHASVRTIAFAPDADVERLLGLMKRIRRKLRFIRIVGGDAPWSLEKRRSAQIIRQIDATDETRERARSIWLGTRAGGAPAGKRGCASPRSRKVTVGCAQWPLANAALCCFLDRGEPLLVLVHDAAAPVVNTAECWDALALTLSRGGLTRCDAPADAINSAARAAADEARAAFNAAVPPPTRKSGRAGPDAANVLRRLVQSPDGSRAGDADRAEAILLALRHGGRAGADIRLRQSLHSLRSDRSDRARPAPPASQTSARAPALVAVLLLRTAPEHSPAQAFRDGAGR